MCVIWTIYLQVVRQYTFLDYIMGGCQLNFTVSGSVWILLVICSFSNRTSKGKKTDILVIVQLIWGIAEQTQTDYTSLI